MCFCFQKTADIHGFNVGWMDYKLPSISSEAKYFAGDKQDKRLSTGPKNNDATSNFIKRAAAGKSEQYATQLK